MAGQGRRVEQRTPTTRVFELARELEMTSRQVLFHLEMQGEPRSTAVSTVGAAAAARLRMRLANIDGLREADTTTYPPEGGSLGADHPSVRAAEREWVGQGAGLDEGEHDDVGAHGGTPAPPTSPDDGLAVVIPFPRRAH